VAAIEAYQKSPVVLGELAALRAGKAAAPVAAMATICIDAGRKDKIRPGDILGALTGAGGIEGAAVGKIDLADRQAYVAVASDQVEQALRCLAQGKIKGRSVRARRVD
jgi:ATP-independent RNA helicase DbpA